MKNKANIIMADIIAQCEKIYENAARIYENLSGNATENDLMRFWGGIAVEKQHHVKTWKKFRTWAENGVAPVVFDKPMAVLGELRSVENKVNELVDRTRRINDASKAFLAAFKLEFYLLHPSFENLLQYINVLADEMLLPETDQAHINRLFEKLRKYGLATMELELLGETIHRLWEDNRRMAVQTNYDPLTKTYNRRGIFNMMKTLGHVAQRNRTVVGAMMIDLDHFKQINDAFGHLHGDAILRQVADTIKATVRASDILGRFGGEEFLVFLSSVNPDNLFHVGEKTRRAVLENRKIAPPVSISIGMSQKRMKGNIESEIEDLIRRADENLYKAKRGGRNRVVV